MKPNKQLIELRKGLNLTQLEFSEKIKVSRSTIADIERGSIPISKRVKAKIVEKFDVESGYFDSENPTKNVVLNKDTESGHNQGTSKNIEYIESLRGENKAIYDTFKLLEKLSLNKEKNVDIQSLMIREAEKLEDKTLYFYLLFVNELQTERPDLQEVRFNVIELHTDIADVIKIFKPNFHDLVDIDIQFADYKSFKKKRIDNLEKLLKYKNALNALRKALNNFTSDYNKLKGEK